MTAGENHKGPERLCENCLVEFGAALRPVFTQTLKALLELASRSGGVKPVSK